MRRQLYLKSTDQAGLEGEYRRLFLVMAENQTVGQMCLETADGTGRASYSIEKQYQGHGFEKESMCLLEKEILSEIPSCLEILAEVKADDIASQHMFEELGYGGLKTPEGWEYKISRDRLLCSFPRCDTHPWESNVPTGPRQDSSDVLFLTNNRNGLPLYDWFLQQEDRVILYSNRIDPGFVAATAPGYIVSYNYSYIIDQEVIDLMEGRIINLHISFLPWNRGFYPNFWSFIEDTPKGVTIHKISSGLDKGDILVQKELHFDEEGENFESTYKSLNHEIVELLKENWVHIKTGMLVGKQQTGKGTYHARKELDLLLKGKAMDWGENIKSFKDRMGLNRKGVL